MRRLLIQNIGMLATPEGKTARRGREQGKIRLLKGAWIVTEGARIAAVGEGAVPGESFDQTVDAEGCLVTPGLVDAHTHLVFGGWRQNELGMKLHGMGYLDILAAGGGILSTVKATRAASEDELFTKAASALKEMLSLGVTACEIKSGYGLDFETERKQLKVIARLKKTVPMEIAATYLGAHALPAEYKENREEYIRLLTEEWIPAVAREGLAEFCDVFCEQGVFTAEESRRILEAGKKHGLLPKIHADEIEAIGGTELTADLKAVSAEHLIVCQGSGIEAMARGGTVACLLPMTSFYLGSVYAPARKMIDAGVPVAVASDFNPGSCPGLNLQLAMTIACLKYRLTPEEMLTAVTLNAAA
ncbi:MAG: imidazolonepropionase, partial [Lachnospiraceae bacterium]|nr:imidazolonepropionase [Lachnospiraceae bacterium]